MSRMCAVACGVLAAIAWGSAGSAKAEVIFALYDGEAISLTQKILVFTGVPTPDLPFVGQCSFNNGFEGVGYGVRVVIIHAVPGPPQISDVYAPEPVNPGTRVDLLAYVTNCTEGGIPRDVFAGDLASPGGAVAATLIAAPDDMPLDLDDEAVVKGNCDDDGNADVVCVGNGPAVNTSVWSDLPLLAGDRIVNFLELWDDPDTGQTFYLADVEW